MKKKYLSILAILTAITLTACGGTAPSQAPASGEDQGTASEAVQSEPESAGETAAADTTDAEAATDAEASSSEEAATPIFKTVTKYFSETYQGSIKEDKKGNSIEYTPLFQGQTQAIMMADKCKDAYPALYNALHEDAVAILNTAESDAKRSAEVATEDLEYSVQNDFDFFGPYSCNDTVSIMRADDRIFSIANHYYEFMGGAHGMYGTNGKTYDAQTGTVLELTDVITITEDELNSILNKKITESSPDPDQFWDLEKTLSQYKFNPKENTDSTDIDNYEYPYNWYMGNDGIHFYFEPYVLANYAYGDTDVFIPYDELGSAVNEKYTMPESKGYVSSPNLMICNVKWDDDTSDLHLVYEPLDPDDTSDYVQCKSLALKEKDKSAKAEIDFDYNYNMNHIQPYKIVTADGREFVYVNVLTYNDYVESLFFEITGGDIKLLGQDTFHSVYLDNTTDYSGEIVPTDPDYLYFGHVGDLLGTYSCYGRYKVGSDGLLELLDKDYTIAWCSQEITLAKELSVSIIDNDGNELSKETLPVKTRITPVKTDNESYVDCSLDDGRMIRLNYSSSKYPAQIDGQDVDDLFEGLMYAG